MDKGVVIHLDNEHDGVLIPSKNLFDQNGFEYEYIICKSKTEFEKSLETNYSRIKALIFDLLSQEPSSGELNNNDAEFLKDIKKSFTSFNIPIFVFSGYLQAIQNDFNDNGTVYKIDKANPEGIQTVFDKLKFLSESGFIDVFCPGGVLETETKEELHKSFINQFARNSQIEEVINSILQSSLEEDRKERVKKVFKRIAIKTLASDLLAPIADGHDKVHPIEHFYKRQSNLLVWTGDIWRSKVNSKDILILTPRCDFAVGKAQNILFCEIEKSPVFDLNAKPDKLLKLLSNHLVDNIDGKAKRYIPKNVLYPPGGMANMSLYGTIQLENLQKEYDYIITLSDDLTNEIIGKFAYYFLRTGITNINEQEFEAIVKTAIPEQ